MTTYFLALSVVMDSIFPVIVKTESILECPLCAIGHDSSKAKNWKLEEIDADHVSAWSRGWCN